MSALVTGMGWLTAAGLGQGRRDAFSLACGALPEVRRQDLFAEHPRFGRMDAYCKAGLAGVVMALRDAGLEGPLGESAGLAATTCVGCLRTDLDYFATAMQGPILASPNLFAFTLPTSIVAEAAICFGLRGPTCMLHEPQAFGLTGVRAGLEALEFGEAELMLAGACDVPALDWPCGQGPAGSIFLVLESERRAQGRQAYGRLLLDSDTVALDAESSREPQDSLPDLVRRLLNFSISSAPRRKPVGE
ncbi:beta-ketoacyl synthase N-terminal-like domain-containing protein [Desulfocurvibacter africanus]|uniref:Beta-ketoacyl synthase n=1 Tax=Desulfocurvibacter africanus subsp. africanus str. Walvis Bay TaxID=690850 RepID=F3YZC5_DESAF|nr:beta-ketoacyl synthase N-terminal-like domain-containing protein [Desulfocurvibacter africanus]EGJ51954.1 Beta-ketoacyl synthase [Desulfocurvibacter africanus subsp. africanus str. Walvis Bay]